MLWFFLGWAGIHRFYVGKVVTGLLYLFTFGLLGFGWFIDLFLLSGYVDMYNVLHKSQNGFIVNNNITISSPNDGSFTPQISNSDELSTPTVSK